LNQGFSGFLDRLRTTARHPGKPHAAAAVLLIRYRVSSVWLILAGGAIGVLDHYLR